MHLTSNIGLLLLAIYLILVGIATLFSVTIPFVILGLLALISGIFLLVGK
jgi:hypothetical protein